MANGTLTVSDLLATQRTVVELGEDLVFRSIDLALQARIALVREEVEQFIEVTNDRARRYGGTDSMTMEDMGEFGTPNAQKISAGSRVEFPLYKAGAAVQWTRTFFLNATAKELAEQFVALMDAWERRIERDIKRGLYYATNKTVTDRFVDNVSLGVKALANADGAPVPVGPYATTFDGSTHTHYLYTAGTSLAWADVDALVTTVLEHNNAGELILVINTAQVSAMKGLTGFIPITPTFVTPANTSAAIVADFDVRNPNNRLIGYYGANYTPVWVKPWGVAGYVLAYVMNLPQARPLVMRTRTGAMQGLQMVYEDEAHPLRARAFEDEFGIGVFNRVGAAVLYIDSGAGGAYVAPTLN